MHFGENQLSRSLIGLSPLPTDHPPGFQPWWVRASTPSYRRFTLPMGRSLRFGPAAHDSHPPNGRRIRPVRTRFRYGSPTRVNLATHHNSQAHSSKGTPSHHTPSKGDTGALTACRHTVSGTISQPLTGALFTFPSRYSSTIGHQGIFRLTTWSWQIHTKFHELRATRDHPKEDTQVSPTGLSPSTAGHPKPVRLPKAFYHFPPAQAEPGKERSHNPAHATPAGCPHVHGLACSPFAHHYSGNHNCFLLLRVLRCFTSPRPHQPPYTFRQRRHPITSARLPHSETPGSQPGCRLPEEYRRLPRPSSDPDAKASTMRPQQLENTKTNTKNRKILASTIQNSKNKPHHKPPPQQPTAGRPNKKTHPPHRTPHPPPQKTKGTKQRGTRTRGTKKKGARFLRTQQRAQTSQHSTTTKQPHTHPSQTPGSSMQPTQVAP
jgi:hypothetical protein